MVQVLLGQGAELNAKDKNGWLSLHYAAKSGFLSTVKLLVDNGSPTTSQTLEGYIPLWYRREQYFTHPISKALQ